MTLHGEWAFMMLLWFIACVIGVSSVSAEIVFRVIQMETAFLTKMLLAAGVHCLLLSGGLSLMHLGFYVLFLVSGGQ